MRFVMPALVAGISLMLVQGRVFDALCPAMIT
jgi:hypothetical protein